MKKMKLFALAFAAMFGMSATAQDVYMYVEGSSSSTFNTGDTFNESFSSTGGCYTSGDVTATRRTGSKKAFVLTLEKTETVTDLTIVGKSSGSAARKITAVTLNGTDIMTAVTITGEITKNDDCYEVKIAGINAKKGDAIGFDFDGNVQVNYLIATAAVDNTKPALFKFIINGVTAAINAEAKTISAELPYGTTIDYDNAAVTIGGSATGWSYNTEKTKLTVTDGTNNLEFTLNITVAGPSTESDLLEVVMSNGTKAFIVNHDSVLTATAVYMKGESVPTVSKTTVSENANAAVEGNVITVTAQDGTTKTPFTLKVVEYEPLATFTSGTAIVFDTTIVTNPNTYLASVYGWDSSKGIKWAKPQNDASNMRIQEGKNRIYLFLPACDSVMFVGGSGGARDVEVTLNGAVYADVKKTPAKDATITIKLNSTTNNLLGFESNGSANGDSGFTSMTLYKGGQPTGIDAIEVLDMNAPMFNLMGQQVTADYKGIVIQNGAKYLLK